MQKWIMTMALAAVAILALSATAAAQMASAQIHIKASVAEYAVLSVTQEVDLDFTLNGYDLDNGYTCSAQAPIEFTIDTNTDVELKVERQAQDGEGLPDAPTYEAWNTTLPSGGFSTLIPPTHWSGEDTLKASFTVGTLAQAKAGDYHETLVFTVSKQE